MKHTKRSHGGEFHHKRSLGQNFIEDEALLDQLAALSLVTQEDCVLEIGPGFGALTRPLAQRAKAIVSLEIDQTLLPILNVTLERFANAHVVHGDVMKTDLQALVSESFGEGCSLRVAANLPYYITTDVLNKLLLTLPQAKSIAVMIQKEVGDKLLSGPGEDGYGPLAILCQYFCDVRRALDVPAACFTPPPKVDSSFMVLERRAEPRFAVRDEALLMRLVKGAFAMRRKTLVNNLTACFALERSQAAEAIEAAGLDAQCRAESLSIEQLCALCDQVEQRIRRA
ncbi:MAG: 16S rRNA (adenine(1518)-N(6)/adenine(1519)-N(6))-dimethyltransferase RsmA [Christensenellales bacterium]|nr:16S rRNA (adenine(1518)-N(6)/adenine(1519)-N(6))-dimethyltransferase RsmA [Christensenellales bacterium]